MHRPVQKPDLVNASSRSGFTLVEIMVSSTVMMAAFAMVLSGFMYMMKSLNVRAVQNELDIDVQTAIERIKYDLRLSTLDQMFFYPEGAGPFTGISFPMARDDDGDGAIETRDDGRIVWDRTVIYHVWHGQPQELRCTIFDPRDQELTDGERQQQLAAVALAGNGATTLNGANARTFVVFRNLFQWKVRPQGAVFDGYAESLTRETGVSLGSAVLSPGPHTFRFSVIGKNPASSGYKVGIDSLIAGPGGGSREAEHALPATEQVRVAVERQFMPGGSWSGNYQAVYPAVAVGDAFALTLENDRWEETNFSVSGDAHSNTAVAFDQSLSPGAFVVALAGNDTNWTACAQTGNDSAELSAPGLVRGAALRVLLRGEEMAGGNWLNFSGARSKIAFRAGGGADMTILAAYMAETASLTADSMDALTGTQTPLTFQGSASVTIPAGGVAWSDVFALPVSVERSYLVTFLVEASGGNIAIPVWRDLNSPERPSTFLIPSSSTPTVADAAATAWSGRGDVIATNAVFGVETLFTLLPEAGVYASRIFDTHCEDPIFTELQRDSVLPSGTELLLRLRTGLAPDLSDAPPWSAIEPIPDYGVVNPGRGRYVQFMAEFRSDASRQLTPRLKGVALSWHGENRVTDICGSFTKGPDYGVFELKVDDRPLLSGVSVDLEIYRDTRGHIGYKRLTSSISAEVTPRNTGL